MGGRALLMLMSRPLSWRSPCFSGEHFQGDGCCFLSSLLFICFRTCFYRLGKVTAHAAIELIMISSLTHGA